MKNARRLAVLLFVFALAQCTSQPELRPDGTPVGAEPTPEGPRLGKNNRISLVLGGAGVASYATVGMLKKFNEEGIEIEFIVATGWPTVFALANSFLKSVHDLEWFATRLDKDGFEKMGSVDFRKEIDPRDALPKIIVDSFSQTLLNQGRVPVVIAATNTDLGEPDVFGSGEWKEPLLRTVSVPGIYRKFPTERGTGWIQGIQSMDVREAVRRGAGVVVAVSMYDDFVQGLSKKPARGDDELLRRVYAAQIRKSTQEAIRQAAISATISLQKDTTDFSAKRSAILAGYREAARIVKKLREPAAAAPN